jgi:hypothetical protein
VAGVAVEGADAEAGVGAAVHEWRHEQRKIFGVIFEVGVEDA